VPTIATASGDDPCRIAGTTNSTMISRLATRPRSARNPCTRPVTINNATNPTVSHRIAPTMVNRTTNPTAATTPSTTNDPLTGKSDPQGFPQNASSPGSVLGCDLTPIRR
jgi:hypothetical protein